MKFLIVKPTSEHDAVLVRTVSANDPTLAFQRCQPDKGEFVCLERALVGANAAIGMRVSRALAEQNAIGKDTFAVDIAKVAFWTACDAVFDTLPSEHPELSVLPRSSLLNTAKVRYSTHPLVIAMEEAERTYYALRYTRR